MTWREVFDCKKAGQHRQVAAEAAFEAGYLFLCQNGRIYFLAEIDGEVKTFDTELGVDTLE